MRLALDTRSRDKNAAVESALLLKTLRNSSATSTNKLGKMKFIKDCVEYERDGRCKVNSAHHELL
jgi:hypothetical protein